MHTQMACILCTGCPWNEQTTDNCNVKSYVSSIRCCCWSFTISTYLERYSGQRFTTPVEWKLVSAMQWRMLCNVRCFEGTIDECRKHPCVYVDVCYHYSFNALAQTNIASLLRLFVAFVILITLVIHPPHRYCVFSGKEFSSWKMISLIDPFHMCCLSGMAIYRSSDEGIKTKITSWSQILFFYPYSIRFLSWLYRFNTDDAESRCLFFFDFVGFFSRLKKNTKISLSYFPCLERRFSRLCVCVCVCGGGGAIGIVLFDESHFQAPPYTHTPTHTQTHSHTISHQR